MTWKTALAAVFIFIIFPAGLQASNSTLTRAGLGEQACQGLDEYCGLEWANGISRNAPFHHLILNTCNLVLVNDGNFKAIGCAERAIEGISHLSPAELVFAQFREGEREQNPKWNGRPDQAWSKMIKEAIARIPSICDRLTPVIFDYFPCLIDRVASLPHQIK